MAAGKVDIGAFRTYPPGHKPADSAPPPDHHHRIPLQKVDDFGVHYQSYYALNVSFFKSEADAKVLEQLWNRHWAHTLSSNALTAVRKGKGKGKEREEEREKGKRRERELGLGYGNVGNDYGNVGNVDISIDIGYGNVDIGYGCIMMMCMVYSA